MTDGLEMGDSSGAAVAAQPRQEVVVHTVREVSGTSWLDLTSRALTRLADHDFRCSTTHSG